MGFYSIGRNCLPKFLLNSWGIDQATYFFDWLISSNPALEIIFGDFDESQFLCKWCIVADGIRVRDLYTGLDFQHDFAALNRQIVEESIGRQIDGVRAKYLRRRCRLIEDVAKDPVPVFIHYSWNRLLTDRERDQIQELLHNFFLKDFRVMFLCRQREKFERNDNLIFCPVKVDPERNWRPDSSSSLEIKSWVKDFLP